MKIVEAGHDEIASWDDRVRRSVNGTIFHTRQFLAYHGDRFGDAERFLLAVDGGAVKAQIALTIEDQGAGRLVRSPYGGSYGSFVFMEQPSFAVSRELVRAFNDFLRAETVRRCVLTPPIGCCSSEPLDTFHFVLLTNGYRSVNRDVSSVVQLNIGPVEGSVSSRARRMARKAKEQNITIRRGNLNDFWSVLHLTFERHRSQPTHQRFDLAYLANALPDQIFFDVAYDERNEPVAGIGYFVINPRVICSFYLAQDPARAESQGLTLLILRGLEESREAGFSFFDLGTSSVGMIPRENIFQFKENFTKSTMFRETFEWQIDQAELPRKQYAAD